MAPVKKKMKDMDVDEFLAADFDSESESSSVRSTELDGKKDKKIKAKKQKKLQSEEMKMSKVKPSHSVGKQQSPAAKIELPAKNKGNMKQTTFEGPSPKRVLTGLESKPSLASTLRENDPEFYDFLKGQDKKLLENLEDLSDSESDSESLTNQDIMSSEVPVSNDAFEKNLLDMSSDEDSESETGGSSNIHKLPDKLEEASDESDDDDETSESNVVQKKRGGIVLTHRMIESWIVEIKSKPSMHMLREIISAFHAAVQEAGGAKEPSTLKYRVEGGAIFNSVVRLCLTQTIPALEKVLHIPSLTAARQPVSEKLASWKKIKVQVKSYMSDLLELLTQLSEAAMINTILKHVHKLIILYASFPKLTKMLLKKMIKLWTTGEETTRVLAFLCINKIVCLKQDSILETSLKQMYMEYVSNCKFTSPTTLPLINFMQKSLVEIFTIDQTVAYQYAFVYIRQLAIHLRNAISVKKKNTCQAVYNWQYIHCLGLWVQLLIATYPSEILQPLVYPLTQTIIGTVKLLPTARFYPLRFHCVKLLNKLSSKTDTYVPTVPFLLEIFEQTDFNKRHKNVSLKPFNFAVILKFSKAQLHEKAFKDGLIDQLYELLLESFNIYAHSVSFPELIIPSVLQLKDFLKKCKIANYCKQIKQIVDKIQEQSKFLVEKRKRSTIHLGDSQAVSSWENQLADSGTPLRKFYTSWRKLRDRELLHEVSNKEAISGAAIDIPVLERRPTKATPKEREDFSKLFENDSDSDDETRFLLKEERPENGEKKRKRTESESGSDDYSDFDDDELEQLAQSASSGEESEGGEESGDEDDSEAEDDSEVDSEAVMESEDEETSDENGSVPTTSGNISAVKKKSKQSLKTDSVPLNNSVDEEDMVEEFALSDFDSD